MVPARYLVVALALAAAAGFVAAHVRPLLSRGERLPGWEEALELRRVLLSSSRATLTLRAYVQRVPAYADVVVDGRPYRVPISRVLVCFRARGAPGSGAEPYEEPLRQLWRAWGNGTHAGAISLVDVVDDGSTIYVRYLDTGLAGELSSLCQGPREERAAYLAAQRGGRIEVAGASYEWVGRRAVRFVRVEVVECG